MLKELVEIFIDNLEALPSNRPIVPLNRFIFVVNECGGNARVWKPTLELDVERS